MTVRWEIHVRRYESIGDEADGWDRYRNPGSYPTTFLIISSHENFMQIDADILTSPMPPAELKYRDSQLNDLEYAFSDVQAFHRVSGAFIHGPTGTGKTTTVRYLLNQLEANTDTVTIYIAGNDHQSRTSLLNAVVDRIPNAINPKRSTTAIDRYHRVLDSMDQSVAVVIDEADMIDEPTVLRDLTEKSGVAVAVVANDRDEYMARVQDRIASRLSGLHTVRFDPYSVDSLVRIMRDRAKVAIGSAVIDGPVLEEIADAATGDARLALRTLLCAVRNADIRGGSVVTELDIDGALPEARRDIQEDVIDSLSRQHQAVLAAIAEVGPCRISEMHSAYSDRVQEVRTQRTIRKYATKLKAYGLVEFDSSAPHRNYALADGLREMVKQKIHAMEQLNAESNRLF